MTLPLSRGSGHAARYQARHDRHKPGRSNQQPLRQDRRSDPGDKPESDKVIGPHLNTAQRCRHSTKSNYPYQFQPLGVAYRIARGRQNASKHCLRLHCSQRLTDVLRNRIHALAGNRLAEVRHFPSLRLHNSCCRCACFVHNSAAACMSLALTMSVRNSKVASEFSRAS